MIGKSALFEGVVPLSKVKKILDGVKGEQTYEQQLAHDHSKKFVSEGKDHEKAFEKIKKALEPYEMSESAVIKVADLMPRSAMTLRQILMKEKRTFTDEEVAKIIAIVKENQ